jgi:AdoMet-dependent heme synthase
MHTRRLVVVWRVTEACDLDCAFCEYRRSRRWARRTAAPESMLHLGGLLGEWQRATGRPVLFSLLGGEPTLWPPLWDVAASLRREHGLGLSVTTNGTRLGDPALRQRLIEDFAEVTLSVDGLGAVHDTVRDRPGLYVNLQAVLADLHARKAALGRGPVLRVNTVLRHSNVRALEALGEALAAVGVEELTFNPLGGEPGDPFFDAEHLQPADLDWLTHSFDRMRQALAAQGLLLRGSRRYLQRLEYETRHWRWPVDDCVPGDRFWFVDEHARLGACRFTTETCGLPVTDLHSLADLLALPGRLAAERRAAHPTACRDCHSPQLFGKFSKEMA